MKTSILLLGDVGLDKNFHGTASELSPEGPYPLVKVDDITVNVGCIGNVVHSVVDFFDAVHLITCLNDRDAENLASHLHPHINHNNIQQSNRSLHVISRIMVGNYCVARFNENDNPVDVDEDSEGKIISTVRSLVGDLNVVVFSDYGKGMLTRRLCEGVIKLCNLDNIPVLVDPYLDDWSKFAGVDWIKPNRIEAEAVFKEPITKESFPRFGMSLITEFDIKYVLCTMDKDGMMLTYKDEKTGGLEVISREAEPSAVVDVIGCGDALIAAISVLYIKNTSMLSQSASVVEFLTKVGRIAVGTPGCYHFNEKSYKQIEGRQKKKDEGKTENNPESKGAMDDENKEAESKVEIVKTEEKKNQKEKGNEMKNTSVVFTNGCFDILHPTHIRVLKECKNHGTYLVIGINTDDSIKRIKGNNRPINTLEDRIIMLDELGLANEIIPFDEDTPLNLIKKIKPDVLVKGGDYRLEDVVGHQHVPKTVVVPSPYTFQFSSTKIIDRCRKTEHN